MKYAIIIWSIVFLISCANKSTTNTSDQNSTPNDTITKSTKNRIYDTIRRLDQLNANDTAVFLAPNGQCYMVFDEPLSEETNDTLNTETFARKAAGAIENEKCDGLVFDGEDRRDCKITFATATQENYNTLPQLLQTLTKDDDVGKKITTTGPTSKRIDLEKRNVTVQKAWLYTFCRQTDEDYHLIIGSSPDISKAKFLNIEISGLPKTPGTHYNKIVKARKQFFDFFGYGYNDCVVKSYTVKFKNKPIPVSVSGSLFFDKLHYKQQGQIGPGWIREYGAKITYWEIHPISDITFLNN